MTSTEELESQIHAQDCELEYWFQQAENYAEVQIPADDLRAIIARTYAAVNALPELLALRADMAKLNEPDGVLINMMRGTIPKVPATSLHKLYTEDELIDAAKAVFRARAALNQDPTHE